MKTNILLFIAVVYGTGLAEGSAYYSYDGRGNNVAHEMWGAVDNELARYQVPKTDYQDGKSQPSGWDRPESREITMALALPLGRHKKRAARYTTDMLTYVAQFFDHDIDLTGGNSSESITMRVGADDEIYDPSGSGTVEMVINRSNWNNKRSTDEPRQQLNQITAYLDGSVVYGSSYEVADALRSHLNGRMLTHDNNMLPYAKSDGSDCGFPCMANGSGKEKVMRAAGDVRANVNPPVLALQTLFVREHNRLAGEIKKNNPGYDDEMIYQEARKWNVAYMQAICFYEYMPMLGIAVPRYTGYKSDVDASIDNFFSTVSYRYGHSEVGDVIFRLDDDGNEIKEGHALLFENFFHPTKALNAGIEPVLRGMAWRRQMEVDQIFASSISHYLFGDPGNGGSDLSARNIARARDHGIPDYNTCRVKMGLGRKSFQQITSDQYVAKVLENIYTTDDKIDPYIGGLAEDHVNNSNLGELFYESLLDQYTRIRDGDRFYFENRANNLFSEEDIIEIKATGLRDVILRNTDIKVLPDNIYMRMPSDEWPVASA
ncbi:hypothetical protein BSKO_07615 [Bryopsis sp. KO-2023]|nr:hypothetical protein BSKO_07615 [Bryopsis sp. KO-2023]